MRKKILLVEDNPQILKLLHLRLNRSYEVIFASNGKEAVEISALHLPDLILLDITLSEVDGIQATRMIRENPRTSSIPILATAASISLRDREEIRTQGADDYIAKPFSYKQLLPHIEGLLKKQAVAPSP